MTLDKIKDDYAVKFHFESWDDLIKNVINNFEIDNLKFHINSVMKIYAMECLKLASENIHDSDNYDCCGNGVCLVGWRVEQSITNENNLIK